MNASLVLAVASIIALEQPLRLITPPDYRDGPLVVSGFAAFPKGEVRHTGFHLELDGNPHPAAFTARALWPDGSLMIMAVETVLDNRPEQVLLSDADATLPDKPPRVEAQSVNVPGGRVIMARTGGKSFLLPKDGTLPFLVAGSGFNTEPDTYPSLSVLYRDGRTFRRSWQQAQYFNDALIRKDRGGRFLEVLRHGYFRSAVHNLPVKSRIMDIEPAFRGTSLIAAGADAVYVHEPATGGTNALRGHTVLAFSFDPTRGRYLLGVETENGFVLQVRDKERTIYTVPMGVRPEKVALYKTRAAVLSGSKLHLLDIQQKKPAVSVDGPSGALLMGAGRGRAVIVSRREGLLRIDQYHLENGSPLGGTNLRDAGPPFCLSAGGMVFACVQGGVVHVARTITGDDICVVKQKAAALGLSPAGDKLALIPEGSPATVDNYGIRVYDTKDGALVLTQPLAKEVKASILAVNSSTRMLAALLDDQILIADTGEWPYRTVYRVWAGAPVVEVRHVTFLSGNPDHSFVYDISLPVILPGPSTEATQLEPGRLKVTVELGESLLFEDDLPPQPWKKVEANGDRLVFQPYSEAFGRPIDLRRYSKWVYTGHLYDESPMWGSRGGQGTGLYSAFLVGFTDKEGRAYRRAWLAPEPSALARSNIWGRFMPSEKAAELYPLTARFQQRLRSMLTCTEGVHEGPFDLGDFPSTCFLDGFLFQGGHGWRNGELGLLEALVIDFLAQPDYERLKTLERAAVHLYSVDMVHFTDRRGDYWSVPPQALGSMRSGGVQHWSGRAGDVRQAGNAVGLADWFLISGDRFAYEAMESAARFATGTRNAGFQMVSLFDLLACVRLAENKPEDAARLFNSAQAAVDSKIPADWKRTWLASLYIIPQYLRHKAITGDARAVEKVNTLSPIQAGQAENLLNLTLYWDLSASGQARRSALRYLTSLMRLPLARDDNLPDAFAEQAEMLQGLRDSLLQKGFPVLRAFPYLFRVMADNGVKEEEIVR